MMGDVEPTIAGKEDKIDGAGTHRNLKNQHEREAESDKIKHIPMIKTSLKLIDFRTSVYTSPMTIGK